jgi:hypothetical protein
MSDACCIITCSCIAGWHAWCPVMNKAQFLKVEAKARLGCGVIVRSPSLREYVISFFILVVMNWRCTSQGQANPCNFPRQTASRNLREARARCNAPLLMRSHCHVVDANCTYFCWTECFFLLLILCERDWCRYVNRKIMLESNRSKVCGAKWFHP